MEEIIELKKYIENEQYDEALNLIGEMEEMSRDDKINKVESYMEVLLVHLIKQAAEKRTTRSWTASIRNSVEAIYRMNKRRKAGEFFTPSPPPGSLPDGESAVQCTECRRIRCFR